MWLSSRAPSPVQSGTPGTWRSPGAGPGSASAPKGLWGADSCPPLGWPREPEKSLVPRPKLTVEGSQQSKWPVLLHRPTQKGPFLPGSGPLCLVGPGTTTTGDVRVHLSGPHL